MSLLTIQLFGSPIVKQDQQTIHIGRRKAIALLAYLAVTQRPQSRNHLAAFLFPDYDESSAKGELRRALTTLNQAIGTDRLEADRNSLSLIWADDFTVDVLTFRQLIATARTAETPPLELLKEAVDLAQNDFLAGFTLDDAPEFEEWQRFEALALRRDLTWALDQLSFLTVSLDYAQSLNHALRWLALDALDEAAHRRVMALHASSGNLSAAYQQYQQCKRLLAQELDAPPSGETTQLYEAIRAGTFVVLWAGDAERLDGIPTPERGSEQSPHLPTPQSPYSLPAHLTPFLGRAHELKELSSLLADGKHRLITLTGPGGIGKTRLALQFAHEQHVSEQWRDGVAFIDLTAAEDSDLLSSTLAKGLNITLSGSQPVIEQLLDYLRSKQMLIVFDNLEQLLTEQHIGTVATFFDELLLRASGVSSLITSRERINLHGETVFNLLGMPFPAVAQAAANAPDPALLNFDAVRLFVQSAQRAERNFSLTVENQNAILHICQLAQGMPLAIDLAAAWVNMLTCDEIASEIAQSIKFLSATAHNLPMRHRSMAGIFEHSWRFLSREEQQIFARLSVFRGGFTRQAAEQVTGATLPLLSMLVDKSLLWRTSEGRFVIHELLRQFAAEKLEINEATAFAANHGAYFLKSLAASETAFLTHERMNAFNRLQPELDNIRHAWDWAVTSGDFDRLQAGLQTLYTLYLEIINNFAEGIHRFGEALQLVQKAIDQQLLAARLQARIAMFQIFTGKIEEAAALFTQSLAAVRTLENQPELAFVLTRYSMAKLWQGDLDGARSLVEEGLAICRSNNIPGGLQAALTNYGYVAQQAGDFVLAEALNRECLELLRKTGDPDGLVTTLGNLGLNYVFQQQYAASLPYLEEALAISRFIGNRSRIAIALTNLMDVYMKLGRLDEARHNGMEAQATFGDLGQRQYAAILEASLGTLELLISDRLTEGNDRLKKINSALEHFCRSLSIANEIDVDLVRVYGITGFGELLARSGEHERAVAILTLAVDFPTTDPDIKGRAETQLQKLAEVLPSEQYQSAQREGRSLSLAEVANGLLNSRNIKCFGSL